MRPAAGEHGLPIRVPVTAEGTTTSQRSRLPARSGSIAAGHRWDLVYAAEQLARRPPPGTLSPPAVPALTPAEWNQAVRQAPVGCWAAPLARSTTPTATSRCWPPRRRSGPAGPRSVTQRCSARSPGRCRPGRDRRRDRCRAFDPSSMSPRERWQTLVDVRAATDRVTAGRVAQHRRRSHREPAPPGRRLRRP